MYNAAAEVHSSLYIKNKDISELLKCFLKKKKKLCALFVHRMLQGWHLNHNIDFIPW